MSDTELAQVQRGIDCWKLFACSGSDLRQRISMLNERRSEIK